MFPYHCLGTNDLARSIRFYDPVMAALGHRRCVVQDEDSWEGWAGWRLYEDKGARDGHKLAAVGRGIFGPRW
ncbi:MAG: hypothetical protein ABIX37_07875 [Gammaproteobacteria bacterium]